MLRKKYRHFKQRRYAKKLLQEQDRALRDGRPVPFDFRGHRLFIAPDESARYHISNSIAKLARLAALIPPGTRYVLDVGAHSGLFAKLAVMMHSGLKVLAFEPHPGLRETLRANADPRVEVYEAAVSDAEGESTLFINPRSTQTSSLIQESAATFAPVAELLPSACKVIALDTFLGSAGIEGAEVLKIDVQGFEARVLRGAEKTIKHAKLLLLESSFLELSSVEAVLSLQNRFEHAYTINDVYLGADIAFSRWSLADRSQYINKLW